MQTIAGNVNRDSLVVQGMIGLRTNLSRVDTIVFVAKIESRRKEQGTSERQRSGKGDCAVSSE